MDFLFFLVSNTGGFIQHYKGRLVAKGFEQSYGIDSLETFSPVTSWSSVQISLPIAAEFSYPLCQMDVKNTFLHCDIQEEVYLISPVGFVQADKKGNVCTW